MPNVVQPVWTDPFAKPTAEDLLQRYESPVRAMVDRLRQALGSIEGVREVVVWRGVPWRWALGFTPPDREHWAYVIPRPDTPALALAIPVSDLARFESLRLSRSTREGLLFAARIENHAWAEWALTSEAIVEDLCRLIAHAAMQPSV